MNEVEPTDTTDFGAKPPMAIIFAALTALHFVCCGVPLLLLSGVSLAFIVPFWPLIGGGMAALALASFLWMRVTRSRRLRSSQLRHIQAHGRQSNAQSSTPTAVQCGQDRPF